MNNPTKIIVGTLLGAGVGVGVAKIVGLSATADDANATAASQPRETFRERLERARVVGEAAKAQREEELRAYFRTKVKDPQAMRENPAP